MRFFSRAFHYARNGVSAFLNAIYVTRTRYSENNKQERLKSEAQRVVHQIEKGLSVDIPKRGFGYGKIKILIKYLEELTEESLEADEVRNRVASCILSYFRFYEEQGWSNLEIEALKNKFSSLEKNYVDDPSNGGLISIKRVVHEESEFQVLNDIASSRHSVRDFSDESVDICLIKKAVEFAQKAPSACNRQAVRCYIIDKNSFNNYGNWLKNIGFFGEYGFDKILLITCKITGYNENEGLQHLVSPGIFVGYLVLALEALNLGACIMQRSIFYDKSWDSTRRLMCIPEDEQSFCLVGIGLKKGEYKVPVSKRLPIEVIMKEV